MDNEKIVKSIKELCKKHNITANQLENKVGLSQGLISRWLKTTPSLDKIIDIADYFDISIDNVVGRELRHKKNNNSNSFISALLDKTSNNQLEWFEDEEQLDQIFDSNDSLINYRLGAIEAFFAKYNTGKFILCMQYSIEDGKISEYCVELFIQPDSNSSWVLEEEDTKQLYELWLNVRSKFYVELDETKADKLKKSFLNEESNIEKDDLEKIDYIIKTPEFEYLIEISKTNEFKRIQQFLSNPNLPNFVQALNKFQKYYDMIYQNNNDEND